jgi:hypothetical protein
MQKILPAFLLCFVLFSCGSKAYHTVDVKKPRYHHNWYKNHAHHKKIGVGRIRVRWFEKQGTKTVKMKG